MRILRWISGRSTYRRPNDTRERRVQRPAACCVLLPVWWRIAVRTRSGVCVVLRGISRGPKLAGPRWVGGLRKKARTKKTDTNDEETELGDWAKLDLDAELAKLGGTSERAPSIGSDMRPEDVARSS